MRARLTCISLGHQEEYDAVLHGELRNFDVLVLLVLERHRGQDVPHVDGRQRLRLGVLSLLAARPGLLDGCVSWCLRATRADKPSCWTRCWRRCRLARQRRRVFWRCFSLLVPAWVRPWPAQKYDATAAVRVRLPNPQFFGGAC